MRHPFAGLSHLCGAGLSAAGLVVLLCLSGGRPWHVSSFAIYGASLIALYMASALYHLLPVCPKKEERLLALDQAAIYLLIAGTYTPICLVTLRGAWGWSLFGIVWGIAAAGIAIRFAWRSAPHWLSLVLYLVMGWLCVVALAPLIRGLTPSAFGWLVAGGIVYSVGAVIFATDRPRLWPGKFGAHDLWHCFVLGGSACHFIVMLSLVPVR